MYVLVHSLAFSSKGGYNLIKFERDKYVQQGNVVAVWLEDMDLLQTIITENNSIEFHGDQSSASLMSPIQLFYHLTFELRVITSTLSYFHVEYDFKYAGYHKLFFNVVDKYGVKRSSNELKTAVVSYKSVIHINNDLFYCYVNKPCNICITVEYGALTDIRWSTQNASVVFIDDNGEESKFEVSSKSKYTQISLEVNDCHLVKVNESGAISINISVSENEVRSASATLHIYSLPAITGLKITASQNVLYQLQEVLFTGSVDPYPYDYRFSFNSGVFILNNLTANNLTHLYKYREAGNYSVQLSVKYKAAVETSTIMVQIKNTFEIVAQTIASVNEIVQFLLVSEIGFNSSWWYIWYFDDNQAATQDGPVVEKSFSSAGRYLIQCKIHTEIGVILRTFLSVIVEPITGLHIVIKPGYKAFINFDIILKALHSAGNEIQYTWSSDDLNIISANQSEVKVRSVAIGKHEISLFATNPFSNITTNLTVFLSDSLSYFKVMASDYYIVTGTNIEFHIVSKGGSEKSYVFSFADDNSSIATEDVYLNRTFNSPGVFKVLVSVKMGNSMNTCYDYSTVSCNVTLEIHVQYQIEKLNILLVSDNVEKIINNEIIYIAKRSEPYLKFIVLNGTDVKFKFAINGTNLRLIIGAPIGDNTVADVRLALVNFWMVGVYECIISVSNHVSLISRTVYIQAEEIISDVSIQIEEYIEVFKNHTFTAVINTGSNMFFEWSFKDGSNLSKSNDSKRKQMFSTPGVYVVSLRVFNHISAVTINKSINVIIPVTGFYFNCDTNIAKTKQEISTAYGFSNGQFVTVTMVADKSSIVLLNNHLNGSFFGTHILMYEQPGLYSVVVTSKNKAQYEQSLTCEYRVQEAVRSVSCSIEPTVMAYVNDEVLITVSHYKGTSMLGSVDVKTRNHEVASYPLLFSSCLPVGCGYSVVRHTFKSGDHYYISGRVYNLVSTINITTQDLLVVDATSNAQNHVNLLAESAIVGNPTVINLIQDQIECIPSCILSFGDGHSTALENQFPSSYSHKYVSAGEYNVTLNGMSTKGFLNIWTVAYVQLKLSISRIVKPTRCVLFDESFEIESVFQDPLMVNNSLLTKIFLNSSVITPVVSIKNGKVSLLLYKSDYNVPGYSEMTILFQNYVSDTKVMINICIQRVIESLSCQTPVIWRFGIATPFQVTIISESRVELKIMFDDEISYVLNTTETVVNYYHHFKKTGSFKYYIQASNLV